METEVSRSRVRIAAAILASLLVAAAVFTYLSYTAAFSPVDTITVSSQRVGLMTERDAKVKYRGIQIGKVSAIDYHGDQATLTLAVDRSQLHFIPANAIVHIGGTTIFGAKSVEFLPPKDPQGSLRPGATVAASAVQLEVNTLFQTLTDLLNKIDPVNLNGTLSALAEGLRGNGDNFGATISGLNTYLAQLNPHLPAMESDFAKTGTVAGIYGAAAPDLVRIFDNTPTIAHTIVDQRDNLNATLLAATGLANNGYEALAPGADDYIAAIQRFRAPAKVLADYSPELGCLLIGLETEMKTFGSLFGGVKPALFLSSSFIPGVPAYTYPESLPMVNASGGPNCRGLPYFPTKQMGGSWYRAPFLVTDNAYLPYEPNTEVQFNAPSTVQFLFNGAFAERDEY